ncbi:hypothetical protein E3C22_13955 [Jiella endophytica]|uniref:PIN domain-containing protein n=1 Tax=Jiella endophytica TaxID=2558362 RepID=A0A4Y8RH15_9HYPH|nr:hypothetical protein [Jiella endophytica]TFF21781.1 hypothetical protein E3C22_13955 [Jiella endophytica]
MARFVIGPDVALRLIEEGGGSLSGHQLLAPTILRSEVLAELYRAVRRGDCDRRTANARLDKLRRLKLRLLGDRVLQRVAFEIAESLDWPDTFAAEYLALTRLQADAFVTLDQDLARVARTVVAVATLDELIADEGR